jgi:enamine deaminase RidA (YjgF/YER057c/UK114 family)
VNIRHRLAELGIVLPEAGKPAGSYSLALRSGALVYLSGTGPLPLPGVKTRGRIGESLSLDEGYLAARAAALSLLANLDAFLGGAECEIRCVKMTGYLCCTQDFAAHPRVLDGATDFLLEVLGENGRPARAALGMASLPFGIPVEIELIVEAREF